MLFDSMCYILSQYHDHLLTASLVFNMRLGYNTLRLAEAKGRVTNNFTEHFPSPYIGADCMCTAQQYRGIKRLPVTQIPPKNWCCSASHSSLWLSVEQEAVFFPHHYKSWPGVPSDRSLRGRPCWWISLHGKRRNSHVRKGTSCHRSCAVEPERHQPDMHCPHGPFPRTDHTEHNILSLQQQHRLYIITHFM